MKQGQTDKFILDLKELSSEEEAENVAEILFGSIIDDQNLLNKEVGKDFLNKCLRNFEDDNASAELKFYTLYIFRFFDSKEKTVLKIFSLLSGHPLFGFLLETARTVDPRKSITEKGKSLFDGQKQIGNQFMRLLLESLKLWSERFPQNSSKEPTKYRKAITKLNEQKVTLPSEYTFYGDNAQKKISFSTPQGPIKGDKPSKKQQKPQGTEGNPQGSKQDRSVASQINFLHNKIEIFISLIEDEEEDDIDHLQREIIKNHEMLQKDKSRFANMNPYDSQPEHIIELFLKLNEFISVEEGVYDANFNKNEDLKSYIDQILIEYDRIFADVGTKRSSLGNKKPSKPLQEKPSLEVKKNSREYTEDERREATKAVSAVQNIIKADRKAAEKNYSSTVNKRASENEEKSGGVLKDFFSRIRDKSPVNLGFQAVKTSIEKQKKQAKMQPPRGKSPHASGMSRSNFVASTVSRVAQGIFSKPPNPSPSYRKYQGQVVYENAELSDVLYELKQDQGLKRFKISHLKNRSLLFENEHIQIGYKSEPLYEECEEFEEMIELELYMGNKSTHFMNELCVKFHGDQRSLVYSSPERVQESVAPGEQVKFEVVIVPKSEFFNLTNMRVSYNVDGVPVHTSCILPASLLKFTTYLKLDKREFRADETQITTKVLQSEKFRLCHYFPPRKIPHYLEEMVELADYSDFSCAGSEVDFELGASVIIKNRHQGLLKIIVRPDLSVVLQVRTNEKDEAAHKDFQLYIQTLMLVLKEAR